jgi:hypothetical protein
MGAFSARVGAALQLALLLASAADCQPLTLQGQLSAWFTLSDGRPSTPIVGIRYVPTLSVERQLPDNRVIDGEAAVNAYGFGTSPSWRDVDGEGHIKPYRGWVRFKSSRFEARAGLQKINFGSALLLRPLRWFDSVDPRDPLQLTEGVYAVLLRGYLPRDFTVWGWGLYGNDHLKGLELNPTRARTPEYGGRLQAPLFKGTLAGSTHHRHADLSRGLAVAAADEDPRAAETRYGIDGKWDVGIGVWFESELVQQTRPADSLTSHALTVGADYTFGVGNGLHLLVESLFEQLPARILGQRVSERFSAVSVNYPLGLIDSLSAILLVDTQHAEAYRFVNWQRTFDRWQFYFMGFWNPRQVAIAPLAGPSAAGTNPLSGKGIQVLAVFNHGTSKTPSATRVMNQGGERWHP